MRLLLALLCLLLPSCMHVFTSRHEYLASGTAPMIGGTAFRAEFIPQQRESGAALSAMVIGGAWVSEVGPYQLRLHAFGQPGDQRWFEIKRLRLTGTDNFNAPMEPRGFAGRAEFGPTQTAGRTRASLLLGPHIYLDDQKQRSITLEAEVDILRRGGPTRGIVRIPLSLTKTGSRESIFIITELMRDLRQRDTMDDLPDALPPPPEAP
ncbi:MAG: hypothetical protein IAE77_08735, partial [Prosthecobacter sp.]|jgi:hypothetical protein|uniref:hypothetical protein n=1 Tax=Prosthecobacter sp. TaxID=1965333 RepID=UPI0019E3E549